MTRICIVEDNPTVRASLRELVESISDCECVGDYGSGEAGLIGIPKDAPDLIMMDINLPGMSGIECTSKLKETLPGLRVLILTVYEDGERIFDALKAGASGYILKRSQPNEILKAIGEMLEGGAPMTPEIALKVVESFRRKTGNGSEEIEQLTGRELEVLQSLSKGLFNKEIADQLGIGVETVRWYLRKIYEKLHVNCRTEAVLKYLEVKSKVE